MNRKRVLVISLLIVMVFYFSFRGILVGVAPRKNSPPSSSAVLSYLPHHECPFNVNITVSSLTITFKVSGLNKTLNYTFYGQNGSFLCFSNGALLYAMYPGDPGTDTYAVFVTNSLKELWKGKFRGLLSPLLYSNGTLLFLKQGSEESNVRPCLYWVALRNGKLIGQVCLQEKHGAAVAAVRFLGGRIYLATSTGHLYMIEGDNVKRAYFDSIGGITVGASIKLDVNEKYLAVAYSFASVEGKEKKGLCAFTSSLRKIACKSLKAEPQIVKLQGNTIYVWMENGERRAYKILTLQR